MHSWKKKLVVSQLALACTLAITSQANAANYDTWGYHDNTTTDLVWPYDTDNDGIADAGGMDPDQRRIAPGKAGPAQPLAQMGRQLLALPRAGAQQGAQQGAAGPGYRFIKLEHFMPKSL